MKRFLSLSLLAMLFGLALNSCDQAPKQAEGLYATIETDKGNMVIELYHKEAPLTVTNFVGLAEGKLKNTAFPEGQPYYDGLTFHRVVEDFVIQGGDPQGNGSGGPGYQFADEVETGLKHDTIGILSMANAGPATNGSQFFITHKATPHLDGKHTVFGKVIEGHDVIFAIEQGDKMNKVTIQRVGADAEAFTADQASFDKMSSEMAAKAQEMASAAHDKAMAEFNALIQEQYPDAQSTESGLHYIIEKAGSGANPVAGDEVKVHYTGTFADGRKFDSSYDRGEPLPFTLGQRQVISGWDEGIALMKKGGKAKLIIPYMLAYGENGMGPIPPYSTLVFETELVSINE